PPPSGAPAAEYLPTSWHVRVINGTLTQEMDVSLYSGDNTPIIFDMGAAPAVPTANWLRQDGPYGGFVTSLVKDVSGNLFAATEGGGVWRSAGGGSWSEENTGITDLDVVALGNNAGDEVVYAATRGGKVFRANFSASTTWTDLGSPFAGSVVPTMLFVEPGNSNKVFVGSAALGLRGCADTTVATPIWQTAPNNGLGGSPPAIYDMAKGGGKYFLGTSDGVKVTADTFVNWGADPATSGPVSGNDLKINTLNIYGSTLQIGTEAGNFYNRPLAGSVWTGGYVSLGGKPLRDINQQTIGNNYVFVATQGAGLKKNPDTSPGSGDGVPDSSTFLAATQGGSTPFPPNEPANPNLNSLVQDASGNVYAGTAGAGVNRWNGSWADESTNMRATQVTSLTKGTGTAGLTAMFAGTLGGGVYRSLDDGSTWTPMLNTTAGFNGLERKVTSLSLHQDPSNYHVIMGTDGGGVYIQQNATDANADTSSWAKITSLAATDEFIKTVVILPNHTILAGSTTGLFRTDCLLSTCLGGTSWSQEGSGTVGEAYSLAVKPTTNDHVYAGGLEGVYINASVTGPGTWALSPAGTTGQIVTALATSEADSRVLYAGVSGGISPSSTVVYTKDLSSDVFSPAAALPAGVKEAYALMSDPDNADLVFVGTNAGVFVSADAGANWSAFNDGTDALTGVPVYSLYMIGSSLYAGTGGRSVFLTSFAP
ncbi:MAG: hypothetical protein ACAI44_01455, partial [Candidatus Sericytochromatia bacterium]